MHVAFYGHARQYHSLRDQIDRAILEVLESESYVLGPALEKFEGELAQFSGTKHAIGVNSGTDALWLAMMGLGIGPGDEVITVANTFFATAEAIWIAGAKVVFVDTDPKTKNIDPGKIEAAVTPRTKAIVPVHLYGELTDMPAIAAVAKKHNLFVIEDCAQAIDAAGDGFKVGGLSDAVGLSFIAHKNLGAPGDAGAVLTNRDDVATEVKRLRNHGSPERAVHSFGFNSRLDDLHAAMLSVKLPHITAWNDRRREIAAQYSRALASTRLELPYEKPSYRHVYHLYVVEHDRRADLLQFLNDAGIDAKCHYPIAIHKQKGYPWGKDAHPNPSLPNSERNAARCVSLPMFPELTQEEIDFVIEKVVEWDKANR